MTIPFFKLDSDSEFKLQAIRLYLIELHGVNFSDEDIIRICIDKVYKMT